MSMQEAIIKNEDGLPKEAFAIVDDPERPESWKLPHHTRAIFRALNRRPRANHRSRQTPGRSLPEGG